MRFVVLAAVALTAVVSAFLLDRIPQDPDYHRFADGRLLFGVSNFWNVATNLRSEEHTSELQSLTNLVCRLLLEIGRASCRERV